MHEAINIVGEQAHIEVYAALPLMNPIMNTISLFKNKIVKRY